jgi:hypothetical protein
LKVSTIFKISSVEIVIPKGSFRLEFDDPYVPLAFPATVVAFSAQVATDDRLRDTKQKKTCLITNVGRKISQNNKKLIILTLSESLDPSILMSVFI